MYEDRLSVINKIVVYVTARNMDPSAVFSDCRFYYRERSLNAYSPVAHWLSIWLPQVPIQVLYGLLFSSIVYPLAGLRAGGQYFMTYMYFAVTADVAAYFLFSCLTALCPSPFAALHYVPLLQILLITMSGFSEYLPNMQVLLTHFEYLPKTICI